MKIERRCACGMILKIIVRPRKRDQVLSTWYAAHTGTGHADVAPASRGSGGVLTERAAQRLAEERRWALFAEYDGS